MHEIRFHGRSGQGTVGAFNAQDRT